MIAFSKERYTLVFLFFLVSVQNFGQDIDLKYHEKSIGVIESVLANTFVTKKIRLWNKSIRPIFCADSSLNVIVREGLITLSDLTGLKKSLSDDQGGFVWEQAMFSNVIVVKKLKKSAGTTYAVSTPVFFSNGKFAITSLVYLGRDMIFRETLVLELLDGEWRTRITVASEIS